MEGMTPEEDDVLLDAENAALRDPLLESLFAGVLLCPAFT